MMINGRACRTEVAKVNRKHDPSPPLSCLPYSNTIALVGSVFLSRVTGGPISEAEARNILSRYGDIQRVWHSTPTENEMFRLPEGIWVQYAYFQDCRDAQAVRTFNFNAETLLTFRRDFEITQSIGLSSHQ